MVYNYLCKALGKALVAVFPFNCILCGQGAGREADMDLCACCRRSLPGLERACPCCANPLEGAGQGLCGRCLRKPPHFDRSHCAFVYQEPVSWLLHGLKYHQRLAGIPVMSRLLQDHLRTSLREPPELIIPMPLHPARQRGRGFNQALEIARPLARGFGIPLATGICERMRDTPRQSELPASRRAANVRNAFRMRGELPAKHVAIVDDVVTTGSTVNELARLLKRNGAETVQVWAVARTPINSGAKSR